MGRRRSLVLLAALLAISIAACDGDEMTVDAPVGDEGVELVGEIEWAMPERFGRDANGDGLIDIPNTHEYVLNVEPGSCPSGCRDTVPRFAVALDATGVQLVAASGEPVPIDSFEWKVVATSGDSTEVTADSSQTAVELPEGEYDVALEVVAGPIRRVVEETIVVRDLVVVSIGDSYAAGEGNPEIPGDPARWADAGGPVDLPQALDHDAAHRSGLAGAAQAALTLERADSHTSVTFIFLAASGAQIEQAILEVAESTSTEEREERVLPAQLDELAGLMGCDPTSGECQRGVDHLIMSAGGNDVGFAFTVGSLIALDPLLVVSPIYQNLLDNLISGVADDIEALPSLFDRLSAALKSIDIDHVILTAYPGSQSVAIEGVITTCEEIGQDLLPGLEVDQQELEVVGRSLQVPLNETLRSVAATHGWTFVDAHVAAFEGHGYCGSDPYGGAGYAGNPFPAAVPPRPEAGVRWFRTAEESAQIQGGGGLFQPERLATSGTFHPNEFGHQAYMDALLEALTDS